VYENKKVAGRRKAEVSLSEEERADLERVLRAPTTSQRDAMRAEIILRSAQGIPGSHVAQQLKIDPHTVRKWRRRFIANGMIRLLDAPRPKESLRLSDLKIAEIVKTTLERKPKGATHWSTRLLAKEAGRKPVDGFASVASVSSQASPAHDFHALYRPVLC
jgi:transposase